jgi:hypothetical protein
LTGAIVRLATRYGRASVPIGVTQTIGMPGLEDNGARRSQSFAIVGQTKSNDFREDRCARAFHDDFTNSTVAERARSTKCVSESLRGYRLWQGFRCHDDPNSRSRERCSAQPSGTRPIETDTGVTLGPSETEPQIVERLRTSAIVAPLPLTPTLRRSIRDAGCARQLVCF